LSPGLALEDAYPAALRILLNARQDPVMAERTIERTFDAGELRRGYFLGSVREVG
jgi:hypothetical protein